MPRQIIDTESGRPAYRRRVATRWLIILVLFIVAVLAGIRVWQATRPRVAAGAAEQGCVRLQWDVLAWNQPAIDFYQELGAQFLDEWRIMRVNDQAIGALASLAQEPIS